MQVRHRIRHDLLRRIEQLQQSAAEGYASSGEHSADHRDDGERGVHCVACARAVVSTEIMRNDNTRTDGHALTERDEKIDERAARPDRRKRVAADKVADDDGVRRVIKLLKKIAQNKRHAEHQQLSADAALCHKV